MSRRDLPLEHDGPLEFAELIRALDVIVGEHVCLPKESPGSGLQVGGLFRRVDAGPVSEHSFAIGDSAWLDLTERDFVAGRLRTFDGNDYFSIKIELQQGTILLGDDALFGSERTDAETA